MKFIFLTVWCILWICTTTVSARINDRRKYRAKQQYNDDSEYDQWFVQKLNHFNSTDDRTWIQRYHISTKYKKPTSGLVFLYLGGESQIEHKDMHSGAWIQYAADFGATCIQLEHRYYGKSYPIKDLRFVNLKYLSVEQVLADAAEFIANIGPVHNISSNDKWIVFGGSYAGSLAMWLRMNYPHLVHGAVSSSGQLIAKPEYHEYFEIVEEALTKHHSPECVSQITYAFKNVTALLQTTRGAHTMRKKFRLCKTPNVAYKQEIKFLIYNMASFFGNAVKYNDHIKIDDDDRDFNITSICNIMVDELLGRPIDKLAKLVHMYNDYHGKSCFENSYISSITWSRSSSWEVQRENNELRQWNYQTCTELGTFETFNLNTDMFGPNITVEFFERHCLDIFGKWYKFKLLEEGMKRINGLNIKLPESQILNVQGSFDPWHKLGFSKDYEDYTTTILVEEASHCADMNYPLITSPEFLKTPEKIYETLRQWTSIKPSMKRFNTIE